jgi:hypothetical protein
MKGKPQPQENVGQENKTLPVPGSIFLSGIFLFPTSP